MTDPTADAAKLLPCPFCGNQEIASSVYRGSRWIIHCCLRGCPNPEAIADTKNEAIARWNTRPQPAPPEGEPIKENAEEITRYVAGCIRCGIVLPNADAWADALQRVADGLSARNKVEDAVGDPDPWKRVEHWRKAAFAAEAELAKAYKVLVVVETCGSTIPDRYWSLVKDVMYAARRQAGALDGVEDAEVQKALAFLRLDAHGCAWIADLLEYVAVDRTFWHERARSQKENAQTLTAKLAEREAELANMDWLYSLHAQSETPSIDESNRAVKIIDAHAARQQQKG